MNQTAQRAKKPLILYPVRMEVARFQSRFLRPTTSPPFNQTRIGLVLLGYALVFATVWVYRDVVSPLAVVFFQVLVGSVAAVGGTYALIAGERERRSWDLLQCAPISSTEIVVAKFWGVSRVILGRLLAFVPLIVVAALGHGFFPTVFGPEDARDSFTKILLSELVVSSFTLAAIAFSLNNSARLKSSMISLVTCIATLVGMLIMIPLLLQIPEPQASSTLADVLLAWHPFFVLVRIAFGGPYGDSGAMNLCYALSVVLFFLGSAAFFLRQAVRAVQKLRVA
jgi:ABC-type Na+ efflux pump permease subunit